MIKLIRTHAPGGDECAPYDVKFDKPYTVGDLVNEVLTTRKGEWGSFDLRHKGCGYFDRFLSVEYRYGELIGELPEDIAKLPIIDATSSGGWSRMDYDIIVK